MSKFTINEIKKLENEYRGQLMFLGICHDLGIDAPKDYKTLNGIAEKIAELCKREGVESELKPLRFDVDEENFTAEPVVWDEWAAAWGNNNE